MSLCVGIASYKTIFKTKYSHPRVNYKYIMSNTHIGPKTPTICMVDLAISTKAFLNAKCGF
jgi:hypothetical protein